VPMDGKAVAKENRALADALLNQTGSAKKPGEKRDLDTATPGSYLRQFLSHYPKSRWRASVLLNLGLIERQSGYYSRALSSFENAWHLSKSGTEPRAEALANRALGEVVELNARLGRRHRLEELFKELDKSQRKLTGVVTEKIGRARQGLWLMQQHPEKAYRCGPMALDRIVAHLQPDAAMQPSILESQSTNDGMTLTQVWRLSQKIKEMPALQMA